MTLKNSMITPEDNSTDYRNIRQQIIDKMEAELYLEDETWRIWNEMSEHTQMLCLESGRDFKAILEDLKKRAEESESCWHK